MATGDILPGPLGTYNTRRDNGIQRVELDRGRLDLLYPISNVTGRIHSSFRIQIVPVGTVHTVHTVLYV